MPSRVPSHIYVYYRVTADTAAARDAVAALLAAVEAATGVRARLLARSDDPATWMEVYEPVADAAAFRLELDELVRKHRVAAIAIDGRRHTESFAALPPRLCAEASPAGTTGARKIHSL